MNPSVSVPFHVYFAFLSPPFHIKLFLPRLFSVPVSCLFAKFIFLTAFDYNPCAIQSLCLCSARIYVKLNCEGERSEEENLRSFSFAE